MNDLQIHPIIFVVGVVGVFLLGVVVGVFGLLRTLIRMRDRGEL
jgi:hypothetical protein